MIVFMKIKEALIKKSMFFKLSPNFDESLISLYRLFHIKVTEKIITQVLMTQAATKAPSSDMINFAILQKI